MKLDVTFDRNTSTKTTCKESELNFMKQIQKKQQNIGDHPIASTIVMTKVKKETLTGMMNEISTKYSEMRHTFCKISKVEFQLMVNKTKKKYGVDDNVSFNTIKSVDFSEKA